MEPLILNLPATPTESAEKGAQQQVLSGNIDLDEIFSNRMLDHGVFLRIYNVSGIVKWIEAPKSEVDGNAMGHSIPEGNMLQQSYKRGRFQLSGSGTCIIHILTGKELPHSHII